MNTVEADQIIREYLENQERQRQIQIMQLRNNLKTFSLKELKKKIIKMKVDKFAVTRMKRDQIIELILAYRYLFPHLLTKQGSKRSSVSRKRANNSLINKMKNNPVYNPSSLKQLATLALPNNSNIPALTYQNIPAPSAKLTPEIMNNINPAELQDIPSELMHQLFTN